MAYPEDYFDLKESNIFGQTRETGKILPKKGFPPQNEPHTESFSGVFKHFPGNSLKNFLLCQESDISERAKNYQGSYFSQQFEKW